MTPDPFDVGQDTADSARLGPARHAFAITPSDTTDLAMLTRGIMVGVAGNVAVVLEGDTAPAVVVPLAANVMYPLHVTRLYATGTTATTIVGFA